MPSSTKNEAQVVDKSIFTTDTLIDDKLSLYEALKNAGDEALKNTDDESLKNTGDEALKKRDDFLVKDQRSTIDLIIMIFSIIFSGLINGIRLLARRELIKEGEIGLTLVSGKPQFVMPGWHTFNKLFQEYVGKAHIDDDIIECGNVKIVKIPKDKIGAIECNGEYKLLKPGRHILVAPQVFLKEYSVNQPYIRAGTIHRVRVDEGDVAVYYDAKGKTQVLETGIHVLDDANIRFREFLSTREIVHPVGGLKVTTKDGGVIYLDTLVQYKIVDVKKLVNNFQSSDFKVEIENLEEHNDSSYERPLDHIIKSTLTDTFLHHNTTEIAPAPPNSDEEEVAKEVDTEADFVTTLSQDFMNELKEQAAKNWGIEILGIKFQKLQFSSELHASYSKRFAKNIQLQTERDTVFMQNKIKSARVENEAQNKVIVVKGKAEAAKFEADAIRTLAEARADSIKVVAEQNETLFGKEAATRMALIDAQKGLLSDANCTFFGSVPSNMTILTGGNDAAKKLERAF